MATQKMNEDWRRLRDRIKALWGEETFKDKNMKEARGSLPQMVNLIHAKTGEPHADIRRKIIAAM